MVLHVDSDTAYLTIPEARSCYAGHFYLSDWPSPSPIKPNPERNGPIHMECKKTRNVVSSAAESETCGNFNNGETSIEMRSALIALDHKQPAITLKTENSTIEESVNSGMKPKRSKTWDMKWHWLRNKELLEPLIVYCYKGTNHHADYFTKHHPPIYHCQMRPRFIHTSNLAKKIPQTIKLCEGVLNRVPYTQSRIESLKATRSIPQSMTKKYHMVRRLNLPRQHIM